VEILLFALASVHRKYYPNLCCKHIQSRNVEFLLFLRKFEELFSGRFIGKKTQLNALLKNLLFSYFNTVKLIVNVYV